eukprot:TRINITY_DN220_c0_g1_i1.p1 TRINITY_DN220_c0_g1~~TRINITY_DN220_c0_g1_i1.p1  ORF type:complete len:282 (-),score=57.23 TRINITY_DN220_c0_g1_i1:217-1062(-)
MLRVAAMAKNSSSMSMLSSLAKLTSWRMLVCVLLGLSLMMIGSCEVTKPWISYNFSCNTTLEAGGEIQTLQWYQDFDFQTIFTVGLLDDYVNHIQDIRNQVTVNYNSTGNQCDWTCRLNHCCDESNNNNTGRATTSTRTKSKISQSIEKISELFHDNNANSSGGGSGGGCGCSNQILPIAMWEFYSESRYLGGCGDHGNNSAWTNVINRELNFTLCYSYELEAPIWVELDFLHHNTQPFLRFTYTNWNGTRPSPFVFEIPNYCHCFAGDNFFEDDNDYLQS